MAPFSIALLQLNFTVGDIEGNRDRILKALEAEPCRSASLCVSTELGLLGYPPRDLLFIDGFVQRSWEVAADLAQRISDGPPLVLGLADFNDTGHGKPFRNCAVLLRHGRIETRYHKNLLPTYDVFDEIRYFEPGASPCVIEVAGRRLGLTICEDVWNDKDHWRRRIYPTDPLEAFAQDKVDAILNISASPFVLGKQTVREAMLGAIAKKYSAAVLYANQVGGADELIFDGRSCAFGPDGRLVARAKGFDEDVTVVELDAMSGTVADDDFSVESEAWRALVTGTRDYVRKSCFSRALLGLSGGIDSSLTAAVAVEALGAKNVLGVLMPSPYSSRGSIEDAEALARNLGVQTHTLPIQDIMAAFEQTLAPVFAGREADVTEENLQARIRGAMLMALSNKFGAMLLTTGNKSELAVGYCTIYGDMNGGLAVISDTPKTLVFRICRWLNEQRGEVVPETVIAKPPSAELRPGQKDQDSLPPYDVLDAILEQHVEHYRSLEQIVAQGFDRATVQQVLRLVRTAEFKRRQAPPGVKITDRAFGLGWRMPLACNRPF